MRSEKDVMYRKERKETVECCSLLTGEAERPRTYIRDARSIARPGKGARHLPDRPESDLREGLEGGVPRTRVTGWPMPGARVRMRDQEFRTAE